MGPVLFALEMELVTAAGRRLTLREWLQLNTREPDRQLYVGTDSRQAVSQTKFTTAIVSYQPGHGGTYAYVRYKTRRIDSLRERLHAETWNSVELALLVAEHLPDRRIIVHLDVNASIRYRSGLFAPDLVGLVTAQGFHAEIKPNSFTASSLADALVKCY